MPLVKTMRPSVKCRRTSSLSERMRSRLVSVSIGRDVLGLLKLDRSRLSPRTPRWWQRAEGARSRGKAPAGLGLNSGGLCDP